MQLLRHRFAQVLVGFGLLVAPYSFAYASTSVSIQSLSPSTNVSVGTNVSFTVANAGFTNPTYTLSDSLSGSSVTSNAINASGAFSWTPGANDVGTHTLTIAINDTQGDSATTTETFTVSAAPSVSIQSLSPSTSVTVGQAVSFTVVASGFSGPTYSVIDSLNGSTVSNSNVNSSGVFSWVPASQDSGTHTITITVRDSSGHTASVQEQLSVGSAASLTIQSLSASSVSTGQAVTFTAAASGFSSPSFSLSDSFGGSTLTNSYINSSGYVSWTPATSDAGTHTITVTATDSLGHTATASQTITVSGSGVVIQGLSPGSTVIVSNPLTFTSYASGFVNPVYTVSDSFGGSTISNAEINSASGYFNWTPVAADVGTHTLTIHASDSYGHSASVTQTILVQTPNITVTSVNPGTSINYGTTVNFTVTPAGFVNPNYTLSDSYSGSTSIVNSDITSAGLFTWTPAANQVGMHVLTINASDSAGHSTSTTLTLYVNSVMNLSLTAPSPGSTVAPGTTVTATAYAYGFTNPSYTVGDSFGGTSISFAAINASGAFTWTPTPKDAGVHTITISAVDAMGHTSSATMQITVTGTPVSTDTTPTLHSGYTFTTYLYPGLTSSDVAKLQTVLTKDGLFSGPISGFYGALTKAAVIAFQAAHGIDQLGVVGPATRVALNSGSSTSSTSASSSTGDGYVFNNFLDVGSTGTDVTELQTRLTALGLYTGAITGHFGSLTRAGVEAFQSAHGISQVGYVGPATRAALNQ